MSNRLAFEKSPYLLQHADNPVDWYPWGEEAFEKARLERKPIFLSVGYSTCHWCHVMAHESFEDQAIAGVLNRGFVPIKVDREERPDVDRVYMLFVQATTGSGGWPMSVWLTPELEPFYGGTYFPPTSRWGRPGFIDVLQEIDRAWREQPDRIRESAAQVASQLKDLSDRRGAERAALDAGLLERAVAEFSASFDRRHGGFGGAPKFPRPTELLFLMREWARLRSDRTSGAMAGSRDDGTGARAASARSNDDRPTAARDMALDTLRAMAVGGICDQVGGGFHRYSVDDHWHVPHFEKMLYDQAQLALAYLEAFQITRDAQFADVASAILDYVSRDLGRRDGGFFSAEDADSLPPGGAGDEAPHAAEGAFYTWTADEFRAATREDADIATPGYGVRPQGNVAADPQGEFAGKNILYLARSIEEIGRTLGRPADDVRNRLAAARDALFAARSKRPRPGLDDKVIVAWNGLAIAAFARAARVLGAAGDTSDLGPRPASPKRPREGGTSDIGRRISDLGPRTSDIGRRISDLGPRTSDLGRRISDLRPRTSDLGLRISDLGPRTSDLGRRISDLGPRTSDIGRTYLEAAQRAASFIRSEMWSEEHRTLLRRYRGGEAGVPGYAEDYACLVFGLLELFQADGEPLWLRWAITLQRAQDERFWDEHGGGWFSTDGRDPSVLVRMKETYDGAEPSATSVGAWNLLALGRLTGEATWLTRAEQSIGAFSAEMRATPRAVPMMLAALSTWFARKQEVVIIGSPGAKDTAALVAAVNSRYLPFAVVIPVSDESRAALADVIPNVAAMTAREGRATAYVCHDFACDQPATTPSEMLARLGPDV